MWLLSGSRTHFVQMWFPFVFVHFGIAVRSRLMRSQIVGCYFTDDSNSFFFLKILRALTLVCSLFDIQRLLVVFYHFILAKYLVSKIAVQMVWWKRVNHVIWITISTRKFPWTHLTTISLSWFTSYLTFSFSHKQNHKQNNCQLTVQFRIKTIKRFSIVTRRDKFDSIHLQLVRLFSIDVGASSWIVAAQLICEIIFVLFIFVDSMLFCRSRFCVVDIKHRLSIVNMCVDDHISDCALSITEKKKESRMCAWKQNANREQSINSIRALKMFHIYFTFIVISRLLKFNLII